MPYRLVHPIDAEQRYTPLVDPSPAPNIPNQPLPGVRYGGGLRLVFMGANFGLNWLNDRRQRQRVQAALDRIAPSVRSELAAKPTHGAMVRLTFWQVKAPPDSLIQPGPEYRHLSWATGPTRSEAIAVMNSRATVSAAPGRHRRVRSSYVWYPPQTPAPPSALRAPFRKLRVVGLVPSARFRNVSWGGSGGFDDLDRFRPSGAPIARARFHLLQPPSRLYWFNGQFRHHTDIPLVTKRSSDGVRIPSVDLDPNLPWDDDTAAMLFPANAAAMRLVRSTRPTRDNGHQLRHEVNFDLVRWVPAAEIVANP